MFRRVAKTDRDLAKREGRKGIQSLQPSAR